MAIEVQNRSADHERFRRMGSRMDSWALASEASVAKDIYAAVASNGSKTFSDLIDSVNAGTLEDWDPRWVARLARVIALQPHEVDLIEFAQRALSLAVAELPLNPSTLAVRKLHIELLFKGGQFEAVAEALDRDAALSDVYHGYLGADLLNPYVTGRDDAAGEWLRRFNAPLTDAGLSPVAVDATAATPFDGLTSTVEPSTEDGPLVSVIVTTFNPDRAEIRTAVSSILQQTWWNLELLLVDDHSNEETVAPLEELAAEDPRVRLIRLPVNGGTYRARNAGIREAAGKYVTGQDTDDWSHPERIAKQVAVLEEDPDLSGVTTAANRTDDNLVKMAPGHNPHRKCEVSLMLRVEDARTIGGYMPVRKAADSEFRERLEAWSGVSTRMIDAPLYLIRLSAGSLSRMDFRPGWSHHARRAFWGAYKFWHRSAPREFLEIDASSDVAGVPSKAPSKIAGREWMSSRTFDVCIVADWRGNTSQQRAARDELNALVKSDLAVAILHLDTPWGAGREPRALHPEVQELISAGKVGRVLIDQTVDVDLLLVREPETMDFALRAPGEVRCKRTVLIGHGALADRADGVRDYDPTNANAMAKTIFGVEPVWALPEGDRVDGVEGKYRISVEEDRYPMYIDAARFAGARWRRGADAPLVLGCAVTNDELSWPDAEHLDDVFPLAGPEEVRVFGDARGALRAVKEKRLPVTWVQFRENETDPVLFWRRVDVAVILGRGAVGPTVDRAALEALASGTIVVTDDIRAGAYEGATAVSSPPETLTHIRALFEQPDVKGALHRRGDEFVRERADPSMLEGYVRRHLSDALSGAENYA